jgi:hypothetical protein
MSCAGRAYKGGGLDITIPFPYGDMDDISVILYTNGDYSIEKTASAVDGVIDVHLSKGEVDIFPDGVLKYTLEWDDYSMTSETLTYIKTPANYSATSVTELVDEAYQSGYTAGQEGCASGTCNIQETKTTSITDDVSGIVMVYPDEGYDGLAEAKVSAVRFGQVKYQKGLADGMAECETRVQEAYDSGFTVGYESGLTEGQEICDGRVRAAYSNGYSSGYSEGQLDLTQQGARAIYMDGIISFDQDTVIDSNFDIFVFLMNDSVQVAVYDGYIKIGEEWLNNLKDHGPTTISAGTYDFHVYINEEVNYRPELDNFWVNGPQCSVSGVSFITKLVFYKLIL